MEPNENTMNLHKLRPRKRITIYEKQIRTILCDHPCFTFIRLYKL